MSWPVSWPLQPARAHVAVRKPGLALQRHPHTHEHGRPEAKHWRSCLGGGETGSCAAGTGTSTGERRVCGGHPRGGGEPA